ncbi:MAG: lasso peptide biosynthesis B2 protein [Thermodesulfobacteriota bacterium]|nr:lasso peptide biosynthesis B2 protein [Thermodesulfobacteriota bacterium]
MQKLGKFLQLSDFDRMLLLEAALCLGIARLSLVMFRFRRIAPHLGIHMAESSEMVKLDCKDFVKQISWALQTASRHLPWKCRCLAQAIAGKMMFKRRGIGSTIYFGVAKDDKENLMAHAWLRCGDLVVTGERDMNQFSVVSTFAEEDA